MPNPNPRIDRVFQGYDTPPKELLVALLLALEDHYETSNVKSALETAPNSKTAIRSVELEGRKFLVRVEEL